MKIRQSSSLIRGLGRVLGGQQRSPLFQEEGLQMIEGVYGFQYGRGIRSSLAKELGNNEGKAKNVTSSGEDGGLAQTQTLAAAGVVGGLGYLLWASTRKNDNETVPKEGTDEEEHDLKDPYGSSAENGNDDASSLYDGELVGDEKDDRDSSPEISMQDAAVSEENYINNKEDHAAAAGANDEGKKESSSDAKDTNDVVVAIDSHQVLGTLESVLTKSGEEMLREDEASIQNSTNIVSVEVGDHDEKVHDPNMMMTNTEENEKKTRQKEYDYEAATMAISTAMADTAADSVMSGMSHDVPNAKHGDGGLPIEVSVDRQNGDIDYTLTASDLLAEAVKRRKELQEDWEEYSARHRQAEADVITLQYLLKERVDPLKKRIDELESEKEELIAATKQQKEMFKKRMHTTLSNIEAMQKELLHAQANALAIGHEREITRERVKQQEAVDSVRLQLDAFATALKRHSDRALKAQDAHTISKAVFTIQNAFESNGIITKNEMQSLDSLKSIHSDDGLVQVAMQALSSFVENGRRVKSREQLIAEFEHNVKKTIKELSYIPKGSGGMVSSLVAKIASKLKADEQPRTHQDGSTATTVDATIANAVQNLVDGEIIEATETLLRGLHGTAAEYAVRDWLTDARNTVEAHQALKLLQAHATCISSKYS
eukprot:jgi/Picsp_1/3655/NSC_06492-R1_protein